MHKKYDDFVIESTINNFILEFNETNTDVPTNVKNVAGNIADKIYQKKNDVVDNIKAEYQNKSFGQIIKSVYKTVKESAVGEFAGEVGSGLLDKLKAIVRFLAKKSGEYSVIALLITSIIDYITPFGILDEWYTKVEWKIGIVIFVSLIVYILARKKK